MPVPVKRGLIHWPCQMVRRLRCSCHPQAHVWSQGAGSDGKLWKDLGQ